VTLLPDGKVLAVGGIDDLNNNLSSAEIYDPSAGTWAATLSLTAGEKSQHTATQLKDGRVMVTGGQTGNPPTGPTAVTEIYDPSGPSWTPSGNLATARYQHSATLLPDANGTVLVTGGYDGFFTFFTSTEIFDPTIGGGTWTTSPASLNAGRAEHSATLLPSGRVLVVGGYVIPPLPVSPLNTAEIYDPAALPLPTWTLVPTPMSTPRYRHSATMLPDGRVLVAAGFDDTTALLTAELLDVDDNPTWDNPAVPNTTGPRRNSTATLLKDGRVLVTGGPFDDTAEVYDPAGPAWTPTGPLTHDRWFGTATLLNDGRVLLAGTNITAGGANTAELYDPVLNNWTLTGPMGGNRYDHAAVLLPCGEVLVVGGESSSGAYLATAERYNPRTDTWRSTGSLNTARRRLTATLLLDGRVLVTGGWNAGRLMSAEIYDPITEIWGPAGDMNSARDEHTAALLPSGMVLITGGTAGLQPAELYDPGSGLFVPTGTTLYPHGSGHTVTLLANGRVLLVGGFTDQTRAEVYDPVSGLWKEVVPGPIDPRHDHSATLLLDGTVLIVGGQGLLADVTAEAFDVNRGEDPAWRPILTGVTNPLVEGQPLVAVGTGFTGVGEASGGLGYMHSASNYPLVQLHRVDNDAVRWLPVDPAVGWADTDFASIPVNNCVPGPTRVTVFTNGIPSVARVIDVECLPPTITLSPVSQDICEGDTVNFTVDATGECRTFRWRKDGSPLAEGGPYTGTRTDTLTVTNATLAEAGSYDAIAELSCSSTTATSAAAALTFSNTLTNVDVSLTTTPATVCATCVGGTITESHVGGVVVTHEWGYRTVSGTGAITWIPGQTNPTYDIDGADFPGPGVYYVVARTTPGCGLPQVSVNEVAVTVTAVAPDPDEVQYFTVTSRDQENVLEWVTSTSYGDVRILYNEGVGCIFPTDPLGPATGLIDQPGAAGLRAFYQHTPLTNDVDYCYTIFSDKGGGSYSIGVSNRGRPMDTSLAVKWSFSTGTFSLTAPTVGWSGVIVTSNDHVVHAVERGVGGGVWPAPWLPIRLVNEPVQSRSPIVPITVNTANPVVYMGAQDGSVYVVDADQGGAFGGFVRGPASLGLPGQAAPAGLLTAYNGAFDYVLVGTRAGADNEFHAFDLDLNPLPPPFDNGGGIGMINGMAAVDYTGPRAFFTSRIGASPSTLWCLDLVAPTPSVFSLAWERALGNIDSSPVIMNDRVYVGSDLGAGTVYAVDVDNILADRSFNHTDGQVKGFVFPDRATADLYFATDSYVWALNDNGAAIVNRYPLLPFPGGIELDVGVVPTSAVVFIPGGTYLYVGGSDGKLYEVDMQPGAPIIKSIMLGDGLATVGAPSLDWQNSVVHVGTEAGVFYAVEVPFP
jgi:hypothetical protein